MRKSIFLSTLTPEEINQLGDSLRQDTYGAILQRVTKPRSEGGLGLDISRKPLETLWAHLGELDLINARIPTAENKITLAEYLSIRVGASPVCCDEVHNAILGAASDLAFSGTQSATQLLALQRLIDFPKRDAIRQQTLDLKTDMAAFRKQTTEKRLDLAERQFAFRQQQHQDRQLERQQKSAPKPVVQEDEWGPLARNAEELSARCRKVFNISDEEWARRQAIWAKHNEEKKLQEQLLAAQPDQGQIALAEARLQALPATTLHPFSGESVPPVGPVLQPGAADTNPPNTTPAPAPTPAPAGALVATVDAYTIKRAQEYWAWRTEVASRPVTEFPTPYQTQFQHCPCGQPSLCPIHETGEAGRFPKFFWKLNPHTEAYRDLVSERGLPYRNPLECVPDQFRIYNSYPTRMAA